jgi:NADH-quinone oxidoreductase subunit G
MTTIIVDGQEYQVNEKHNLLQAVLSLGLNLEYFCWHPALGSVGACRQCAVKHFRDENDTQGQIVMACMTPVQHGMHVSIDHPEAENFRAQVIEWLMVNHPHDCPVCDEGGECHLQDMTVMSGHTYRRFRFNKRTYHNQYLGPFINHEMNRCIQCYRCVRFYRDYAGGDDLDVFGAHDHVYFGRLEDGVLESENSGNLVEICPTGVFTDKTLKQHYTRKWDLQTAPSICMVCGLGCNTLPGERYGILRRIRNRYNQAVNGYFLCDRGRYGYEFVNSPQRIRQPFSRIVDNGVLEPVKSEEATNRFQEIVSQSNGVIGIGSPRASLEANYALRRMVGNERFYAGWSRLDNELIQQILTILQNGPARTPSLQDISQCDTGLVLGEDLTNTAPLMALALRQMVRRAPLSQIVDLNIPPWNDAAVRDLIQDQRGHFYIAAPFSTGLDDIATQTFQATPQDLARLGFAIANLIDPEAPEVPDLPDEQKNLAEQIARSLMEAGRPVIVAGISCRSLELLQAAANIAWALRAQGHPAELSFTVPEGNSLGLGMLTSLALDQARQALDLGEANTLIVLENNLYRRKDILSINDLLDAADNLVVLDSLENETTRKADLIFPASTFAEGDGTLVSNEGRAQRFYQVFAPEGGLDEIKKQVPWENWDQILAQMAQDIAVFAPVIKTRPPANFRITGMKIPRQPHRYSGRTAMRAQIDPNEPIPPDDHDSPLAFSMEGFEGQLPPELISRYWSPGWNSVQALNKFQAEVGGPLRGGNPGQRLIEPEEHMQIAYFDNIPPAFATPRGKWLVVPRYHIFGSEPLSLHTAGINELSPQPYLALNPEDAIVIQISAGDRVSLEISGEKVNLPVKLDASLPDGLLAIPVGLPGLAYIDLPAWSENVLLTREES